MKVCNMCGNNVNDTENFCPTCGNNLTGVQPVSNNMHYNHQNRVCILLCKLSYHHLKKLLLIYNFITIFHTVGILLLF